VTSEHGTGTGDGSGFRIFPSLARRNPGRRGGDGFFEFHVNSRRPTPAWTGMRGAWQGLPLFFLMGTTWIWFKEAQSIRLRCFMSTPGQSGAGAADCGQAVHAAPSRIGRATVGEMNKHQGDEGDRETGDEAFPVAARDPLF
jgi:hypothetical protein